MNEKLQEALAELITLTIQGKDFVLEQAPDVITQLLAWNFTVSLIWFIVGGLMVLIIAPIWTATLNGKLRDGDNDPVFAIIYSILAPLTGLLIITSNMAWLQIAIAPKVYLLEYASGLIK